MKYLLIIASVKQQSILEFMDEEDMGQTVAGETLVTKADFSDTLGKKNKSTYLFYSDVR